MVGRTLLHLVQSDVSVSNLEYLPSGSIISFNPDIQFRQTYDGFDNPSQIYQLIVYGKFAQGSGDVNATLTEESGGLPLV